MRQYNDAQTPVAGGLLDQGARRHAGGQHSLALPVIGRHPACSPPPLSLAASQLHCLQVVLGASAPDDDREVVGRAGGGA